MTPNTTAPGPDASAYGCLTAAGVLLLPLLLLVELQQFFDALEALSHDAKAVARQSLLLILLLALPVALFVGWRRGRHPLNTRRQSGGARAWWLLGVIGAAY